VPVRSVSPPSSPAAGTAIPETPETEKQSEIRKSIPAFESRNDRDDEMNEKKMEQQKKFCASFESIARNPRTDLLSLMNGGDHELVRKFERLCAPFFGEEILETIDERILDIPFLEERD
jgi:hypothetical protein